MFFLIRMAFWLSVVFVLLPTGGGSSQQSASAPGTEIGAISAVSAASATVSDMRQFCSRQPDACAIGSQAAVAFGQRAQAGAKMVYEIISERAATHDTGSISTKPNPNGTKPLVPAKAQAASQNTLTTADLAPPWRGARREAHNQHGP